MHLDDERVRERLATAVTTVLVVLIVVLAAVLLWLFFDSSVTTEGELPSSAPPVLVR
jgi:type VI protein secretion system component VasF